MNAPDQDQHGRNHRRALIGAGLAVAFAGVLVIGTWRQPHFWLTADQRGDRLFQEKQFSAAARTYADLWRIGVAQYRNGDFEAAAKTFTRVPGADGAFDQGNAWLMRGKYVAAMESYDRALGFRPGWKEAEENQALAAARLAKLEAAGKDRDQEQLNEPDDELTPDKLVFEPKNGDQQGELVAVNMQKMSDQELRALWLRRVHTTPGDFLRAKFAYQAGHSSGGTGEGTP